MQIEHKKNTAYYLAFPMVDSASPASFKAGVSPVDTAYSKDGAGAWTTLAITDTATEIASTGVYEIDLTAAELNHDQVIIKFAVAGAADSAFLLDMRTELAEDLGNGSGQVDLLTATQSSIDAIETDTNSLNDTKVPQTLNLTASGNIGIDWGNVENQNSGVDLSATDIQLCDTVTLVTTTTTNTDLVTAAVIADAVWNELATGHTDAGKAGQQLWTDVDAILVDTNSLNDTKVPQTLNLTASGNIGIDWANVENQNSGVDLSATDIQLVDTTGTNTDMRGTENAATAASLATAQLDLDKITGSDGATLATAQALYAPAIPSEVLTQVNAALDTAISELNVEAPTATPTTRTALMLLYMALRNKTVVTTIATDALEVYNDADVVVAKKLLTDDGTDYAEAQMTSG